MRSEENYSKTPDAQTAVTVVQIVQYFYKTANGNTSTQVVPTVINS